MPDIIISILTKWKEQQQAYRALQPNNYHDSDYVCTKPNGELISPDYVTQHFAVLLKQNNMPKIRFHDLRHSSANFLRSIGFDMKDIQTWLRHKDIQTTMNIYVNLDMEAKTNIGDALNAKFELLDAN
jgi:integrase